MLRTLLEYRQGVGAVKCCCKCRIEKDEAEFSKSKGRTDGLNPSCKQCDREKFQATRERRLSRAKEYNAEHAEEIRAKKAEKYQKKREQILAKLRQERQNNPEIQRERCRVYDAAHKQEKKQYNRAYAEVNKEKIASHHLAYSKEKRAADPLYRAKDNIRALIYQVINVRGFKKASRTEAIVGCSFSDLLQFLGPRPDDAHLDHICPCSQARDEQELLKLQHYTNLRWLPAQENLLKSDNKTPEGEALCLTLLGRLWQD